MGETAGIFTPRAQFIPLGNVFGGHKTSVRSNSFHFTCRKVLYFQEKHFTDFNEEGQ